MYWIGRNLISWNDNVKVVSNPQTSYSSDAGVDFRKYLKVENYIWHIMSDPLSVDKQ